MKLVWTRPAAAEHRANRAFIAQDNPTAALTLDVLFLEKAEQLADHPGLGRPGRVAGTRELVVHRNFVLIYDVDQDTVRILAVVHVARQWPPTDDIDTE